jgi:glycine cleavage system aminomethyltransferase T
MKPEYQRYLFEAILKACAEFGIGLFGLRALDTLRPQPQPLPDASGACIRSRVILYR